MPLSHAKQVNHGDLEAPGLTHLTEDEGGQAAEVLSSQELREEVAGEVEFWRTGVGACHDTPDEEVCIEPENGKALAEQVLKLYRDPARCRALGTSGRHYVLAHFDRQVLARKLTDVMQHVVNTA